jgi:hypothetical protein
LDAYPEAKLLSESNINDLITKFGSSKAVANAIGSSEAFVRQKYNKK